MYTTVYIASMLWSTGPSKLMTASVYGHLWPWYNWQALKLVNAMVLYTALCLGFWSTFVHFADLLLVSWFICIRSHQLITVLTYALVVGSEVESVFSSGIRFTVSAVVWLFTPWVYSIAFVFVYVYSSCFSAEVRVTNETGDALINITLGHVHEIIVTVEKQ